MVCSADIVLASPRATFTMAYTAIGLSPDGSTSWFLPRLVGLRRAAELTLTNRRLSAEEALDWGIVTRLVDEADLKAEALKLAGELAQGPTGAFGRSKRLLQESLDRDLRSQLAAESKALAASGGHKARAAEILGLSRVTTRAKLRAIEQHAKDER